MLRSFCLKNPALSDYPKLKALWQTSFDDAHIALDNFFNKTVSPQNTLCIEHNGEIVSALYMLECDYISQHKVYSAYYIYGVCTHPQYRGMGLMHKLFEGLKEQAEKDCVDFLFLVPAEKYLFDVYKKEGFQKAVFYTEKTVNKNDFPCGENEIPQVFSYSLYREYNEKCFVGYPLMLLKKQAFESFFYPATDEIKIITVRGKGYAVTDGKTVFELCGDKDSLLKRIFYETGAETLTLRVMPEKDNSIDYGMIYSVNGELADGCFFGVPYSV